MREPVFLAGCEVDGRDAVCVEVGRDDVEREPLVCDEDVRDVAEGFGRGAFSAEFFSVGFGSVYAPASARSLATAALSFIDSHSLSVRELPTEAL